MVLQVPPVWMVPTHCVLQELWFSRFHLFGWCQLTVCSRNYGSPGSTCLVGSSKLCAPGTMVLQVSPAWLVPTHCVLQELWFSRFHLFGWFQLTVCTRNYGSPGPTCLGWCQLTVCSRNYGSPGSNCLGWFQLTVYSRNFD